MLKVPTSTKVVVQASRDCILKQTLDGGCPTLSGGQLREELVPLSLCLPLRAGGEGSDSPACR